MRVREFKASEWKEGDKVVARNGTSIRVLCIDKPGVFCVVGITMPLGASLLTWDEFGSYYNVGGGESEFDLFVKPIKVTKWMNVYKDASGDFVAGTIFDTRGKCIDIKKNNLDWVKTTSFELEE